MIYLMHWMSALERMAMLDNVRQCSAMVSTDRCCPWPSLCSVLKISTSRNLTLSFDDSHSSSSLTHGNHLIIRAIYTIRATFCFTRLGCCFIPHARHLARQCSAPDETMLDTWRSHARHLAKQCSAHGETMLGTWRNTAPHLTKQCSAPGETVLGT